MGLDLMYFQALLLQEDSLTHSLPNLYQTVEVPKVKTQPGHLINNAVSSPIYIYNHKADPHFLKQQQL